MKQVRFGVFETNSSSTHSLVICTEEEYERFRSGKMLLDRYQDELVDPENLPADYSSYHYYTYHEYLSHGLETYSEHFTTPSGDKMVAFGEYGYDG